MTGHYIFFVEGKAAFTVPDEDREEVSHRMDVLRESIGRQAFVTSIKPVPLVDNRTELVPVTFHRCRISYRKSTSGLLDTPQVAKHSWIKIQPFDKLSQHESEALSFDPPYSARVNRHTKGYQVDVISTDQDLAEHMAREHIELIGKEEAYQ